MSLSNVKSELRFLLHNDAIEKVAASAQIFDSIDNDVASLRLCMQQSWLPLASSTQLVESKVKDSSTFKVTGRSEDNSFTMAMSRSVAMTQAHTSIKE